VRRILHALAAVAVLAALGGPAPAAARNEDTTTLRYTISEARAYSYRVSLRKEVIEAARRAEPCDPAADPYGCDTTRYNHQPNCPPPLAAGAKGEVPEAGAVPGTQPIEGGADRTEGAGAEPPLASPVSLNELVALGRLGRSGDLLEAGGLASDSYVDLSGRQEPEMHTESDILPGIANVEERCLVEDPNHVSYRHFLSRSFEDDPSTYHVAECFKDECTFDRLLFSAQTAEARSIVDLREEGGKVLGNLRAMFQDASWGGGAFTLDALDTTVSFESDGTADGLRWSVSTTVAGAELGGRPITLPTGRIVGNADLQVGIAAPYVEPAADGSALRIVAPGIAIASREQTAFFAGAEITATFGTGGPASASSGSETAAAEATPTGSTEGTAPTSTADTTTASGGGGGNGGGGGETVSSAPAAAAAPPQEEVSISHFATGALGVATVVGAGLLAAAWILFRWAGQFPWSRDLYRLPPFSLMDRFYRAFLKS
jgi:hypothetical protein